MVKCTTVTQYGLQVFDYDRELGIYRCPSYAGLGYADGGEDYIDATLKKARDLTAYSPELAGYIRDWPSRYHLSPARNNLLEGIASLLEKNSRVLEIGSGCGAITRWLGERFAEVDAIEGSLQRAVTTRMRTSGLDNVRVYFGDISKAAVDRKYDIITLIGVIEYIPFFEGRSSSDPQGSCISLLKRLKEALSKRGILVLATENRMGAKYFSGCKEDHCGKHFIGIEGYSGKSPVTFSRNELEGLLRRSGFNNIQFYHLFPDYKLTGTMIPENDEALALKPYNWIKTPFEDYGGDKRSILLEPLFLKSITDAGLLWQLSNSFLVLASPDTGARLRPEWLLKKFNNESHGGQFRHQVTLEKDAGGGYVVRRTPAPGNGRSVDIPGISYRLEDEKYICGELLSWEVFRAMREDDQRPAIVRTVKRLHDSLISGYSTGRTDGSGYPMVYGSTVDYTMWNLVRSGDGTLHFFDRKWRMTKDLPADFVLFRNLFYIYYTLYPFLREDSRPAFIVEVIRAIYPQYSLERLKENAALEEEFQTAVSNRKATLCLDHPPVVKVSVPSIVFRRLKGAAERAVHGAKARLRRGSL